jgi:hypothetical protein
MEKHMKRVTLTAVLTASCLAISGCGGGETNTAEANNMSADADAAGSEMANDNMAAGDMAGSNGAASTAGASGSSSTYPKGSRLIEENGVTYRVDADGTRVRLAETEGRIITENGVRYRVDGSGGNRVRIDERGIDIDLDTPNVKLPDVDVGVNKKGNLDVDVNSKKDGNSGPN